MRRWNPKDPHAPFNENGDLMHYPEGWYTNIEWRKVEPFQGRLRLEGYARGRSAAYFYWLDGQGHRYPMFLADVAALLQERDVVAGEVHGWWRVVKRGQNYGLALHDGG